LGYKIHLSLHRAQRLAKRLAGALTPYNPWMSKSIHISIPHQLTVPEVRARLTKGMTDFRTSPMSKMAALQENWQGDVLHLTANSMGQNITGRIEVKDRTVDVYVDLPMIFAMFASKVKGEIEQHGRKLLEKK